MFGFVFFFFFQAEDGIRDADVTGVQTCALPILRGLARPVCAYVYDRATLRATAAGLRAALPPGTLLCYAVKANGHPDVVAALASTVDGLEVASGGELALRSEEHTS